MAESIHEQISAAIQTRLQTIAEGAASSTRAGAHVYAYTPDKVFRVLEFSSADLDDSFKQLLFLRPDTDTIREGATTMVNGDAQFTVLIAKKDERTSKSPLDEEKDEGPIAAKVIGRCVADVRAALLSEVTLGALAWNVMQGSSEAEFSDPVDGWLVAKVTFTVRYDYAA